MAVDDDAAVAELHRTGGGLGRRQRRHRHQVLVTSLTRLETRQQHVPAVTRLETVIEGCPVTSSGDGSLHAVTVTASGQTKGSIQYHRSPQQGTTTNHNCTTKSLHRVRPKDQYKRSPQTGLLKTSQLYLPGHCTGSLKPVSELGHSRRSLGLRRTTSRLVYSPSPCQHIPFCRPRRCTKS